MRVEIGPRQYSIRIYDNDGDDYIASCQLFVYGDRSFMYNINGRGFYGAIHQTIQGLHDLGIVSTEGYVSRAHARLLRRILGQDRVTIGPEGDMQGHKLCWVTIT